ncbi:hypothetical protein EW146_g6471 [Bondarzewia mesenterica]|uniref:Uncharacterized protein n=1 Tax=Bondarzewia mesenterica TaxID=1095465 RepID=A0A4S4LQH8_9AGAM|nr:hypothetical protein EW146_g6471 [Bondarzewia mesenterica]
MFAAAAATHHKRIKSASSSDPVSIRLVAANAATLFDEERRSGLTTRGNAAVARAWMSHVDLAWNYAAPIGCRCPPLPGTRKMKSSELKCTESVASESPSLCPSPIEKIGIEPNHHVLPLLSTPPTTPLHPRPLLPLRAPPLHAPRSLDLAPPAHRAHLRARRPLRAAALRRGDQRVEVNRLRRLAREGGGARDGGENIGWMEVVFGRDESKREGSVRTTSEEWDRRDLEGDEVAIAPSGAALVFDILEIFPFTSESKRTGMIVRDTQSGEIAFTQKGAGVVNRHGQNRPAERLA